TLSTAGSSVNMEEIETAVDYLETDSWHSWKATTKFKTSKTLAIFALFRYRTKLTFHSESATLISKQESAQVRPCLKNSSAGLRPAMNRRLARENPAGTFALDFPSPRINLRPSLMVGACFRGNGLPLQSG